MEPDFDKIISNRIRQTEQRPVSWNKEEVLRKVRSQTGTRSRYHFLYYVAAAVLPLLFYLAIKPVTSEISQPATDVDVRTMLKPSEAELPDMPHKAQGHLPDRPTVNDHTAKTPVMEKRNNSGDTIRIAQPETQTADVIPDPLSDFQVSDEGFRQPEVATVSEQKIKPIVGVVTESSSENVANVKRRKRLRERTPSDPTPWEDPGNALVFAVRSTQ